MSKSVITDSLLTAIADAIRAKTGGQASMTPAEMAQEIAGISGANPPYAEYTFLQGGARVDAVLRGFSVIFNGMFSNSMSIQNVTCASDCNITSIEGEAFSFTRYITTFTIPATVETISSYAFRSSSGLREIKFLGTPTSINTTAFANDSNLGNIYVPWAEGDVAGAPWGATNATIHYNTTFDANSNVISG